MGYHYLSKLFAPKSIAVFGASEDLSSAGARLFENIQKSGFRGKLFPVNPKHQKINGAPCYASIDDISKVVELAVIATPAATVPKILRQCGEHGVRGAIVVSAGFAEAGAKGKKLERELFNVAKQYGIHVIGPNCLGIIRPSAHMNATFSKNQARPGKLALVSQSGAMCTAILDWAEARNIGFSAVVSIGEATDVGFGDVLDYLSMDPQTSSILVYIEGIRNARGFMSGLRVASRMKPVVVIKSGRHEAGSKAAMSHSGALVGRDDVFEAALDRAGVVRASNITQLFSTAEILASGHRANYDRLVFLTNGGGPGVMAADRAQDVGIQVPELAPETIAKLNKAIPPNWSNGNPIDILGDADAERYSSAMTIALDDPGTDGLLVMLTPQAMTEPTEIARRVIAVSKKSKKPVMACWMGEQLVNEARHLFDEAGIPNYRAPEQAVEAFANLATYRRNQKLLMQVPTSLHDLKKPDVEGARLIIESVLAEGRNTLGTVESKAILSAFRIPVIQSTLARSPTEALIAAESAGFPVAMKINASNLSHKSDSGGVQLDVPNAHAVRNVYKEMMKTVRKNEPEAKIDGITVEHMYRSPSARELLVGVSRDSVFGPVISFGMGGTAVEIHRDTAVALPPLNSYMIDKLIAKTRVTKMLGEFRNMPAINCDALKKVLLRVSEMVCELPEIIEADINPLIADEGGVIAVDARFRVNYAPATGIKYDHMAIHPYPVDYVQTRQLPDGTDIVIRPIHPNDSILEQQFVRDLFEKSRYMRFMHALQELTPEMLVRFTQIDYDREMCFMAVTEIDDKEVSLGVARYAITPDGDSCEFALVTADAWQGKGLGFLLMKTLMRSAREKGLSIIEGDVLANNAGMLRLMSRLGFEAIRDPEDFTVVNVKRRL